MSRDHRVSSRCRATRQQPSMALGRSLDRSPLMGRWSAVERSSGRARRGLLKPTGLCAALTPISAASSRIVPERPYSGIGSKTAEQPLVMPSAEARKRPRSPLARTSPPWRAARGIRRMRRPRRLGFFRSTPTSTRRPLGPRQRFAPAVAQTTRVEQTKEAWLICTTISISRVDNEGH